MPTSATHRIASWATPDSRGNVAIVRSLYAAFSRLSRGGEVDSYVEKHFAADCEYRPIEEARPVRGHAGISRWIKRWLEAWEDAWDEVDEIVESGGTVIASVRVHGRGRKSGVEISQRLFDVHELRNGRVVRVREFLDHAEARAAAGLPLPR